jgi:glycine/D-amino acid oxidase-like deaminating enzyme
MLQVDYIIVGQGVSGSFLAWYLNQAKKSFLVIDNNNANTASRIASGVINPITGRRFVRTWMIEEIMPFAANAYQNIEADLNATFIEQKNIINFHTTPQMQLAFEERLSTEQEYLSKVDDIATHQNFFNFSFGVGEIKPCWWINMPIFIKSMQDWLLRNSYLLQQSFDVNDVQILNDEIAYKDIKANKILFCDGAESTSNPWFKNLPFAINKGEAILFSTKDKLPTNHIFKQGLTITPWQEDLFWIGSTYEWNFDNTNPTDAFKQKVVSTLNYWLKSEFTIEHHVASVRPANVERRPFVGLHPTTPQIGILNGMGAKGCSLAPYFANELVQHLLHNNPINKLADVNRFSKVLQKNI